jgi:hypothetical protein
MAYRKIPGQGAYAAGGRRIANPNLIEQHIPDSNYYPWGVLVTSLMLVRRHQKEVLPVVQEVLRRWPREELMAIANLDEVIPVIKPAQPIGRALPSKAHILIRMAQDFNYGIHYTKCAGITRYGTDAWKLFVHGNIDFVPRNIRLKEYVRWAQQERKAGREYRTPFAIRFQGTDSSSLRMLYT